MTDSQRGFCEGVLWALCVCMTHEAHEVAIELLASTQYGELLEVAKLNGMEQDLMALEWARDAPKQHTRS